MTTIVGDARHGLLASDSFVSTGYRAAKLFRTKGKGIFGTAGDDRWIGRFEAWLLRRGPIPDLPDGAEFEALQLHRGRLYVWGAAMRAELILNPFDSTKPAELWAIGSGGHLALATLYQGGTYLEALRMAELFDESSKGPMLTMKECE